MMTRLAALAAALILASCGQRGLRGPLAEIRAEIQALERSIPPEAPLWHNTGDNSFNRYIEDYTPRIPDFIYNHVAAKLAALPEADLEAAAEPKFDLEEIAGDPATSRGKIFRVTGRIASLTVDRYALDGTRATREVFQGALFVGDRPVLFHLVTKPDVVYLGSDEVDFVGVFVKILTYPSQGGPAVSAPFFMARSLRKFY